MLSIDPKEIPTAKMHQYLLGAVGPRPIAFASTIDAQGRPNLSPFSFFNVFSANPPVLIFSPARRGRDNTVKHTFNNAKATMEVVINVVNYEMVHQVSLSSTEYEEGVNEFEKAGFSMLPSEVVKPFRVAESPVQFECRINEIVELGDQGGAGNLVICEVLKMHVSKDILDEKGYIDQHKIDLVARMGGNWYTRAISGMFEVPKPLQTLGIGVDAISEEIRNSKVLTGNDLGKLGNVEQLPSAQDIISFVKENPEVKALLEKDEETVHRKAKECLENNEPAVAWKILLAKKI
ncbi:NADH-FMN oxidoreductase RutF, flavin reductase (DIM6/NTAB) family [Salinimicrobium catena]|uniref:NADH-FMN oxidoreductase RutF, flavin reductase (DIM6/NTAB) family n=1 Tax=Salinimicrobium catena TaxID=390640 RepID=A0A1H5JIU8_9FLAO|nr:flavin reductase family protein [Salinimicrobium catena]SDK88015.1 NADH-FMN oxidoreductase RutF, flavin reductase (DIM6/NTAB) family [Salinimicrobium catena]SEE52379.1 NADH-FMN oxidoreductase RutF, flavin reductase (DIM6/NTAB) family [Salinimicrobium catena]